jgi:hypothetical protein
MHLSSAVYPAAGETAQLLKRKLGPFASGRAWWLEPERIRDSLSRPWFQLRWPLFLSAPHVRLKANRGSPPRPRESNRVGSSPTQPGGLL